MSWNPNQNDPYASPPSAFQPQGGNNPYAQNPYAQNPYGQQQPPRNGGSLLWLWLLLGIGGGLLFLCCGGCCLVGFFALNEEEQQIQARIENHPVIVEHIGKIQSVERDWLKSAEDDDDTIWIFRVVGDIGEGDLTIKEEEGFNIDEDEIQIEWAKLRLDSGEEFDILP